MLRSQLGGIEAMTGIIARNIGIVIAVPMTIIADLQLLRVTEDPLMFIGQAE